MDRRHMGTPLTLYPDIPITAYLLTATFTPTRQHSSPANPNKAWPSPLQHPPLRPRPPPQARCIAARWRVWQADAELELI